MFEFRRFGESMIPARGSFLIDVLREQWICAALLGLVWCGDIALAVVGGGYSWVLLPGVTLMAVLALAARRAPVVSGLLASAVLTVSTIVARLLDLYFPLVGPLRNVLPTENLAGLLLVVYAFWKAPRVRAAPVTLALVLACLLAVFGRLSDPFVRLSDVLWTFGAGALQLVLAVGTGLYLRGREARSRETELQVLLRKQWPVIAALCVLLFGQVATIDFARFLPGGLVLLLSCLIMSGLAVVSPLRPVETALLGACTLLLVTALTLVLDITSNSLLVGSIPVPVLAAGMLLTAFVTRHAAVRSAVWVVACLVSSAVVASLLMPRFSPIEWPRGVLAPLGMGGMLLILSVGTGMYFRARDRERESSVQAAVAGAQHAERMALARELHDVVAHHVTGIVVQAQAAGAVAERNPEAAQDAMERISTSGTEALAAMRRLVGSMRDVDPAGVSVATEQATTDLESDLETVVAQAGPAVADGARTTRTQLEVRLERRIPQEVARSVLRLVQEAVTNARKHAPDATLIRVSVAVNSGELRVLVADDGTTATGRPAGGSGGYGLVGMRERIALLDGWFTTGPGADLGWRVEAGLPLEDRQEEGRDDPGTDRR